MNKYFLLLIHYLSITITEAQNRSIIDLTYTYNNSYVPAHPKYSSFNLKLFNKGTIGSKAVWFYSNDILTSEHAGTHIDAPIHMGEDWHSVDEIPLENLYRIPGILINVTQQVKANKVEDANDANYAIQVTDIQKWIDKHGDIPDGAIVIFHTGWGNKSRSQKAYVGVDARGVPNFPGISAEAAEWMVNYRNSSDQLKQGIIAVGIDTLSLDVGNSNEFRSHLILLRAGIFGIENVANTTKLPPKDFTITMLPMKIARGSGSPTRMIAEINGITFASDASSGIRLNYSYRKSTIITLILCLCASTRFS